ncbi:unnamed protein product, partial [Mesorhabditis belari]|uniref:Glucosylceramidase n=1 Tax=Mesorhabditis belari TaxID=2138241 RepID=A0AAF3J9D3_9BILA
MLGFFVLLFVFANFNELTARNPCAKQFYTPSGGDDVAFGCICDANYCDDIEPLGVIQSDAFVAYVSSEKADRLDRIDYHFTGFPNTSNIVQIDASKTYQKIFGFGGAMTDAAGVNLVSLSQPVRDRLLQQYYGPNSIDYRFTRVPMASCDFSTREYSYADVAGDFDLVNFNLTQEDFQLKIPFIKQAQALVAQLGDTLKLFTTAWSAPGWMKDSGSMKGGGRLIGEVNGKYYQTLANYYKRFFEEYHKLGIDFWGVTPENEPTAGLDPNYRWQAMYLSDEMERDWIKGVLGPTLRGSDVTKDLKIMIGDDQRGIYPKWADTIFSDPDAAKYVDGMALHWYEDLFVSEKGIAETTSKYPDKFMLATEACTGFFPWEQNVLPGNWKRAEMYALDIIEDLRSGVVGWIDWNLVLDQIGGPNWVNNTVDAAIIANATVDQFLKQPMYYALGHFSAFIKPDYKRIDVKLDLHQVDGVAFVAPDGKQRVLVMLNRNKNDVSFSIQDQKNSVRYGNVLLEGRSMKTIIWNM